MPGGERFEFTRPLDTRAQRALGHQAHPEKLSILNLTGEKPLATEELVARVIQDGMYHDNRKAFIGHCSSLVDSCLLKRESRGVFTRTKFGTKSLDALAGYREALIDPLFASQMEILRRFGRTQQADQLEQDWENVREEIPYPKSLRRIMAIYGNDYGLNGLLSVPLHDQPPATNKDVMVYLMEERRVSLSWFSFYDVMHKLQNAGLIRPVTRTSHTLTRLGEASLRAFNVYQEILAPALEQAGSPSSN